MATTKKRATPAAPEVINGYTLIKPFSNNDSGFARWSFAKKNGKEYFIKEFLSPVCPQASAVSPEKYRRVRSLCDAYCVKKLALYDAINRSDTGNIVTVTEFFFFKTRFYITTDKVNMSNHTIAQIAAMSASSKILLMKVLASCMKSLHANNVVHADLKPSNILIKRTKSGSLTAKVIDFDGSYLVGEQPKSDDLQGDQVYLAPETCRAMFGEKVALTQKVDVFALGILFHQYFIGEAPSFPRAYQYAHEALLEGASLTISDRIPPALAAIIRSMLCLDPDKRASMETVFEALQESSPVKTPAAPARAPETPAPAAAPPTRAPETPAPAATPPTISPRLKLGTFAKKASRPEPPPVPSDGWKRGGDGF